MIEDLEDNYPEFVDDVSGYTWDVWDVIPLGLIDRHDAMLESDKESRAQVDLGITDDLVRWAYCRAAKKDGDPAAFLESARLILAGERVQDGVAYDDIFCATIEALANEQLFDEAKLLLTQATEFFPENSDVQRTGAFVSYHENGGNPEAYLTLHAESDDLEFSYEIAEDLFGLGEFESSKTIANDLSEKCDRESAIWVDVEILLRRVTGEQTSG